MKKFLLLMFCLFCLSLKSYAVDIVFDGFISDNAHLLSKSDKNAINNVLTNLQNATKADVVVVTLPFLFGQNIEDVSLEIGRKYKLGDKKLNNGAVFLVALNDRKARIEIGYGLEEYITDAHAGKILDEWVIPYFKEEQYAQGIVSGTLNLAADIMRGYNHELEPIEKNVEAAQVSNGSLTFFEFIFWLIMIIIFAIYFSNGNYRGGGGFGSGGGSSFRGGGFGGSGGFGGGGSTRGW